MIDDATKAHRKRADKAWSTRNIWDKPLREAYDFVAPHRRSTRLTQSSPSAKVDRIFDNHAMTALHRVTGRLLEDVFPSGEPLIALEPGEAVPEDDREDAFAECAAVSGAINSTFLHGGFDAAAAGMVTDGLICSGYMLALDGDASAPVKWVNVPQDEVAVDSGPYGALHGYFWKKLWPRRAIKEAFPKGNFERDFLDALTSKGEEQITLCQDTIYDAAKNIWRLRVYIETKKSGADIWTEDYQTCPWVAFRYFRLPGEDYGYGPILQNMPLIKTLNKTTELALKGAALAAMGIYTMIEDGVFNPDTARLEPAAMWKVARNGGPLGPSIQRLPNSTDPNLSMVTIQDLRLSISAGMNDQELPPDGQSPRSAAEIIERSRRLRSNHSGAFSRIVNDVFLAIAPRVQEILVRQGVLKKALTVDNLLVRMKVLSPLGRAFRARRAENWTEWAQVAAALGGPEALRMVTPLEPALLQLGRDMGVDERQLRPVSQQQELQARIQEAVAAAMEAMQKQGAAGAPPPPANGDPAQAAA